MALALAGVTALSGCQGEHAAMQDRHTETVARQLRDPGSAEFRDLETFVEQDLTCGEVNGRNAFGGYAGFQPFVIAKGRVAMADDPAFADLVDLCSQARQSRIAAMKKTNDEREARSGS